MTNKNTLEIIIKANSQQAIAALNKLQSAVSKPFAGLQKQVGALGNAFTAVTGLSLGTAGAFTAVGMAASKAVDFVKQSVAETVAYAQSVRELSYVLGTGAEETSRIIQVADDYLISTEKLTTALRFAVKNGFEPSVESLAQLADQFNAIADPNERAAKMVEIFGRNWTALVPLLKAGGDAIRENAAAISEGLVLNDTDIQAAFEYQQALDQLGDSVQDLKYRIGMELVPAMADVLTAFNTNASMAEQMSRSFEAFNGVMDQSNRSALALENAFQLGFNVSPRGLVDIAKQLQAIEDPMKRVAEAQRIFGENWVEVYGIIELAPGVLDALSGSLGKIPPDMNEITRGAKVMAGALDDAAGSAEALAEKEKRAGDALKDYAKAITRLGLSTAQESALIEQFATALGGVDTTALVAANDMDLLDAALAANAITLGEYTAISLTAAQGTGELDDTTRAYLETQLAAAEGQAGFTGALKGTANAATLVRDQLVQVIGLAEKLRFAGPREIRTEIFEQLKGLLSDVDPAKAEAAAAGIEAIGLAFGVFNANDLEIASKLPEFVKTLFAGISEGAIDPEAAPKAVQAFLDAVRNVKLTGEPIDLTGILADFIEFDPAALSEELKYDLNGAIQNAVTGAVENVPEIDTGAAKAAITGQISAGLAFQASDFQAATDSIDAALSESIAAIDISIDLSTVRQSIVEALVLQSEDIQGIANGYRNIVPVIQEAIKSSLDTGGVLETNPILEQFFASPEDISAIQKSYEPVKAIPQELVNSWSMFTGDDGASILATSINDIATATRILGDNAEAAEASIGLVATNAGLMATNAAILRPLLDVLNPRIEDLSKKSGEAYSRVRNLAGAIGALASAALKATMFIGLLSTAIAALRSKTITLTVNVDVNDPFGILGGGGGSFVRDPDYKGPHAKGGPVERSKKYLVGERGPELFIPKLAGIVAPMNTRQSVTDALIALPRDDGPLTEKAIIKQVQDSPRRRGEPQLIGQEGPELFIPPENGTIIPANTTQSVMRTLAAIPQEEDEKIPGFALGGRPKRKKPAIVGERGPEIFIPDVAGTIIPTDVTQAVVEAIGVLAGQDAFGGNNGQTPAERAKNRREDRPKSKQEPSFPVVSGVVPQSPPGYKFLGENLDAYLALFRPPFGLDTPTPEPERETTQTDRRPGKTKFPGRSRPETNGESRRQQKELEQAIEQTYQPLNTNLFQVASQGSGVLDAEQVAVATAATETERLGQNVTYNNYFPVQKIDDELDARDLARKVAAELARMPSR